SFLYGTTTYGGPNGAPTMFMVDESGAVTTVHVFQDSEGGTPSGPLILASDGNLYGTATGGGAYGYGAVFRTNPSGDTIALYSFGAPDVSPTITSFTPTAGPTNTKVTITGTGFTGVSSVKFNGQAAASVTVLSSTLLTARVASG